MVLLSILVKLLNGNVFIELLYMDTNKEWTNHTWDVSITDFREMATIFRQVAINNAKECHIILIVDICDVSKFRQALLEAQYRDIDILTWVKSDVYQVKSVPPNQRYVRATETILIARSPAKILGERIAEKSRFYIDNNPKRRYDFFMGPDQADLQKHNSSILNKYEKPEWLASFLAKPFVKQGDTALVFGGGAGGDVAGLLDIGLNVVCLENDNTQYYGLQARFEAYQPEPPRCVPKTMYDLQPQVEDWADDGGEDEDDDILIEQRRSNRLENGQEGRGGDPTVVEDSNHGNIGAHLPVNFFY